MVGRGNRLDCSNPLNDTSCPGYADAYQTQQCDIDQLYSESCPGYAQAYQTQQCDIDQLYSEACPGYAQVIKLNNVILINFILKNAHTMQKLTYLNNAI